MIVKTTLDETYKNLDKILSSKENITYIGTSENTQVSYGFDEQINIDYCNEHNIKAYQMRRDGGCIVLSKGNIGVLSLTSVDGGWIRENIITKIVEYLVSKGINAVKDNNDVLVDGYKVASGSEMRVETNMDMIYSSYEISINVDLEAIQNICTKPMVKIPKGLSEFGVTTEEMVALCEEIFK